MRTAGISGGSGFVGRHVAALLLAKGWEVVIFSRKARKKGGIHLSYAKLDAESLTCDTEALARIDVFIHLAGAGIANRRWKRKRKQEILESRVRGTEFVVSQLQQYAPHCRTFVSASAVGYYGYDVRGDHSFTEDAPAADDFLGNVCLQWEAEAQKANKFARTVILRFGIVLGKEGGAFPEFAKPVSLGVIPVFGHGGQTMSWIEVHDLARMILFAAQHQEIEGVYNAVAPEHVTQAQLVNAIAKESGGFKIHFHVPGALLKILLGEVSGEILKSSTVSPQKIIDAGFSFKYPDIRSAVQAVLKK